MTELLVKEKRTERISGFDHTDNGKAVRHVQCGRQYVCHHMPNLLTLIMVKYVSGWKPASHLGDGSGAADLCAERGRPGIDHSRLCKQLQVIRGIAKFDFMPTIMLSGCFGRLKSCRLSHSESRTFFRSGGCWIRWQIAGGTAASRSVFEYHDSVCFRCCLFLIVIYKFKRNNDVRNFA
ncbi:hypothetical protein PO124_05095 [Bacillus licheniformis]|nr:hypothetical protein [Bacillus licheniformis]